MPSTDEREAQPVFEEPCPKCGGDVVLRNWEGRFFTKCKNKGCFFGFDTDNRGNPISRCSACGTGRLRTTPKGRVCADCNVWEAPNAGTASETPKAGGEGLGLCPKCKTGQLAVRNGQFGTFVSCSVRCGLSYGSDAVGNPEGGNCRTCQGPVKKTQSGSRVCAVCGTWQDEKKAAPSGATASERPKDARCPRCSQIMKTLFTRRQKWAYRCEQCQAWYDA